MKSALKVSVLASSLTSALAVAQWGQCGGTGYTGSTACDSGLTCVYVNDYYSQCLAASTTVTTKSTATTTTSKATSTTATTTTAAPVSTGFVKTSGTKFTLNGSTFTVVGVIKRILDGPALLQLSSTADITSAFADLSAAGFTTLRTWGFNDVTSPGGTYYQLWSGTTGTVNTGADGLAKFDTVVAAAKAAGIRLIVSLTNNWSVQIPRGNPIQYLPKLDVYVKQILGSSNHDLFYTDATVKAAFKSYINTWVTRYKNDPTILAWELANEPRCKGSTGTWSGTCTTTTITNWATEISAYIKSIDSNHLVALGDEGFYNQANGPNYPYQGGEGIDFDANLKISTLDFGTFHSYPVSWGQSANATLWGVQWIRDHAASQKSANKPVIIEEFGVTSDQATTYTAWWNEIVSTGGVAGDLIWQAGSSVATGYNDGYAVYPGTDLYTLQTKYAAALKARG
ncbi:unnamed protein product [Rhizoctonia solani]|uniref:mannan endo-1,4-beta-mannosidase n=1 Tax=Rhizoctonia solani TaxID=456999 RepID=A0A8H3HL82_9AGAM|nr:unnamed protein product [Rhizoctonia solani]